MQRAEGLAVEPHALGGGRHAQRCAGAPHLDVMKAGLLVRGFDHSRGPRLNRPGCPGAGGGSWARRRMIETGIEKKRLASGVEYTIPARRPPGLSARRMPENALCWSGNR